MIPTTYNYGRCIVRTYNAPVVVHEGRTKNEEEQGNRMGTEGEVEDVKETEKEEEEEEPEKEEQEQDHEEKLPSKKRKGRVTGTLKAPSKQLSSFIFPVQRAPSSSELRTSPILCIPARKVNAVISALEEANAAVIEARDSALVASQIADRAYSAAYDTAKNASSLVDAMAAVTEAVESLQDAAKK